MQISIHLISNLISAIPGSGNYEPGCHSGKKEVVRDLDEKYHAHRPLQVPVGIRNLLPNRLALLNLCNLSCAQANHGLGQGHEMEGRQELRSVAAGGTNGPGEQIAQG